MKITMHNGSVIEAQGTITRKNRTPIYCITTGEVYASQLDAARILGVSPNAIFQAINGKGKPRTCKGLEFCYCSAITERFERIAVTARISTQKANAYDSMRKANEKFTIHKANCEKLREELAKELQLMSEAQAIIDSFEN